MTGVGAELSSAAANDGIASPVVEANPLRIDPTTGQLTAPRVVGNPIDRQCDVATDMWGGPATGVAARCCVAGG